jgi:hypothetical protein
MLKIIVIISVLFSAQISFASKAYVLVDIQQQSDVYTGSVCKSYKNAQGELQQPDFRCGQKVSMVLSYKKDQLAFLETPSSRAQDGQNKTFDLFHGALLQRNRQCEETVSEEVRGQAIFNSNLCRAFRSETLSAEGNDVYVFVPNMKPEPMNDADPLTAAIYQAILVGGYTGIPVGIGQMDTITLSRSDVIPNQVVIENTRVGVAFFVKAVSHRQFIFRRGDR